MPLSPADLAYFANKSIIIAMNDKNPPLLQLLIVVTPNFNLATTCAFIDPFRAANYLEGTARSHWTIASVAGGRCPASNGLDIATEKLTSLENERFDIVVVSSSWTPEAFEPKTLLGAIKQWARAGSMIGALDTGAFILADAGLLKNSKATVHYEHIDAFKELHGDITVTEELFVHSENRFSCAGGLASADIALHIISKYWGDSLANAAARYIFHPCIRKAGSLQNPLQAEPIGIAVTHKLKQAISLMEQHLEETLSIPEIAEKINISHRQLDRIFLRHTGKSPVIYYLDIRLDRARGLVTQTDMSMVDIAIACGFSNQVHFSRAYHKRFGLPPRSDRIDGRIPFEFRAWPMYRKAEAAIPAQGNNGEK